jgi:N-acetylglutamate synthase-like GNAT family acetyltransferase
MVEAMDPARFTVRRATVDDLSGLKELWNRAHLQVLDLEKRLTDFQLVVSEDSDLLAAAALRVEAGQGWLNSEAFAGPEDQDTLRQVLWERVTTLSANHGLTRLWTTESAPYWHQVAAFHPAEEADLKKLPGVFGPAHQRWQTLVLKGEDQRALTLEQEFELFQQYSQASVNQVMSQAQMVRWVAYGVAGVFLVGVFGLAIYWIMRWMREGNTRRPTRR